jgi:hypothetical protein
MQQNKPERNIVGFLGAIVVFAYETIKHRLKVQHP